MRTTLGGFERWDAARGISMTLDRGWLRLDALSAHSYADVIRIRSARNREINNLRRAISAEAAACGHSAEWEAKEIARLIHG